MKESRYKRIDVYDFTYIMNKNRQVPAVGGGDTDDILGGAGSAHVSFLDPGAGSVPHVFNLWKPTEPYTQVCVLFCLCVTVQSNYYLKKEFS